MKKSILISIFLISMCIMLSTIATAEESRLTDTSIDYVAYREIEVGKGAVYQIKITNTGTHTKEYEIIPSTEVIRQIGTYSIDPSDKVSIAAGKEETIYLYLSLEKSLTGRTEIPVQIKTGFSSTTITLVVRSIGPLQKEEVSQPITKAFKIAVIIALIIIIIIALILLFFKMRKKEEKELEKEFNPEVEETIETYY